ncbi:hypothetical protein TNCV_3348561 [Trichonephila clavipes]|nr:hypothetical protein TNCV_3348561 [Trichonephila clavipes]
MPQEKVQCVHWLTEFKSVTRAQRRVRTEWNADPPTSKSIHQWDKNFKGDGNFGVLINPLGKPVMTFHSVRTRRYTGVTDLNSANQSTHCTFCYGVHIFTHGISVKSLSSAIAE